LTALVAGLACAANIENCSTRALAARCTMGNPTRTPSRKSPNMPKPPKAHSASPTKRGKPANHAAKGGTRLAKTSAPATQTKLAKSKAQAKPTKLAKPSAQAKPTKLAKSSAQAKPAKLKADSQAAEASRTAAKPTKLAKSSAQAKPAKLKADSQAAEASRTAAKPTKLAKPSAQAKPTKLAKSSAQAKPTKLVEAGALAAEAKSKPTQLAKPTKLVEAGAQSGAKPPGDDLPIIAFAKAADWRSWLDRQHKRARGLWVKFARKGSGIASIDRTEAVDGALCYGWIDGQGRSFDEHYYLVKFTPRGPRSIWSKINRVKSVALIEQGLMQPAGLSEVERAQRDGRWDAAYDSPRTAAVPDDLALALDAHPRARASFAGLNAANRYAILWQLQTAKKPETRTRRIERFIDMLERGETLH
jgi:uncharacterized protein YdeI (YjbR/CyaY-like superfamily)